MAETPPETLVIKKTELWDWEERLTEEKKMFPFQFQI